MYITRPASLAEPAKGSNQVRKTSMERCKDSAVTYMRAWGVMLALDGALAVLTVCLLLRAWGESAETTEKLWTGLARFKQGFSFGS